jgi:hypothetical protein
MHPLNVGYRSVVETGKEVQGSVSGGGVDQQVSLPAHAEEELEGSVPDGVSIRIFLEEGGTKLDQASHFVGR